MEQRPVPDKIRGPDCRTRKVRFTSDGSVRDATLCMDAGVPRPNGPFYSSFMIPCGLLHSSGNVLGKIPTPEFATTQIERGGTDGLATQSTHLKKSLQTPAPLFKDLPASKQ